MNEMNDFFHMMEDEDEDDESSVICKGKGLKIIT